MIYKKIRYLYIILLFIIMIVLLKLKLFKYNNNIINNYDSYFIKEIKQYSSFNQDLIDKYYNEYIYSNNIIYSLNKINYPLFFDLTTTHRYINTSYNLILINPKFYIDDVFITKDLVEVKNVLKINRENEIMKLNSECFNSYLKLYNKAVENNIQLVIYSSFRTVEKQKQIYYSKDDNSLIAKPYHSEHHTALSIDIATYSSGLTYYFESTDSFKFLDEYAHQYGFILRYPKGKENITGYNYEPWHYRYVGIEHAMIMKENDLTLEEYIYNYIPL